MEDQNEKISLLLNDLNSLEKYVHDLFTFSPLPICFVSPLNVVLEVNPAFEELSGYSFNELVGERLEKVMGETEVKEFTEKVLKSGVVKGREMKFFPKGGGSVPVQIFARAREDEEGQPTGYFVGALDLSEIREREKELQKSQKALLNILEDSEEARERAEEERKKTQTIIRNLSDGLFAFDPSETLILVNPKGKEFFEVEEEELAGKSLEELSEISNLKSFTDLISGKMEEDFSRKELKLREGLILEVSNIVIKERAGDLANILILHDITREKVVERLKTEFVSIAAHQLRTPLSAIKWTLRMILDGDLGEMTEEQREYVQKTYDSNERMINLVNSLLSVSRIEEGRFVYKPTMEDMEEIVERIVESHREKAKRKDIELVFKKPEGELPDTLVDQEKIQLAIQNLVDNALKYTLKGGKVVVTLKKMEKEEKEEILFKVEDNGVGIPEDQQNRVFSKFFRGANVMRLETEGTGLGLFIAKNIIEAHEGDIWFESKEGGGTTFWFTLPVKKRRRRRR